MEHPLQQLGPTGFQDLAAALAGSEFGPEVQVMGRGRDGGRDMYHQGELRWGTGEAPLESWDGYTVFQVKYKEQPASRPSDNASWLWGEVRKELNAWANPGSGRRPIPDSLVFITNISLSAVQDVGGHDRVRNNIENFIDGFRDDSRDVNDASAKARLAMLTRLEKIKRFRFWDGNQIQSLLTRHPGIRRAFPAFLTANDVFESFSGFTDRISLQELKPALLRHGRASLTSEGQIYFDEAGSVEGTGFPVHTVAVDLPIAISGETETQSAISYVIEHAEHVLKPSLHRASGPRHLVLTGGPGNGKTTLSKFVVQTFRAAMLKGSSSLSQGQIDTIEGTRSALNRLGRDLPKHRRWAMRVDLAEYAEKGLQEESTLLRWIAHKVSNASNEGNATPSLLQTWQGQWPWFLVLDGLDEVADPENRKRLIRHVTSFVEEAEAEDHDVLVVLTTRPMGYTENIAPHQFQQIDLGELSSAEALHYGTMVTKVRLGSDADRVLRVETRLKQAAADEALRPLLKTPLQVLILTIIVDGSGRLPPDRYHLFRSYYETVYRREAEKLTGFQQLLQEHRPQISKLHEKVGFALQRMSESVHHSHAALSSSELYDIAREVLDEYGFEPSGKDSYLLERIIKAAKHRLVLIVHRDGGFGFEVRSLQELTASAYITNGPPDTVIKRLRIAAASPHWRNVWLFAAGQFFSTSHSHQQEAIVDLLESLDDEASYRLGKCVPIAPRLALDILDDGMARAMPKWQTRIAAQALRTLLEPHPLDLPRISRVLLRFASTGDSQSSQVSAGLRDALAKGAHFRQNVTYVQRLITVYADDVDATIPARSLSSVKPRVSRDLHRETIPDWDDFLLELETHTHSDAISSGRRIELTETVRLLTSPLLDESPGLVLLEELQRDQAAVVLEAALGHVVEGEVDLYVNLRDSVLSEVHRKAVGELLQST